MEQENFTFLDLLRDVWRHIGKYLVITVVTVLLYLVGILVVDTISRNDVIFVGLLVVLFMTNCTGYLAGKLNRILKHLENNDI